MRTKKIQLAPIIISLLIAAMIVSTANAGSFHFTSLSFSLGGSMVVLGDLVGLGKDNAVATLSALGTVTALCENKGGQQALGRNPISISVQQTDTFQADENGRTLVRLIAPDPTSGPNEPSPTPKTAGCPNGNWMVVGIIDGSTDWTAATLVIKDENGLEQANLSFTCTTFFENGIGASIQCTQS